MMQTSSFAKSPKGYVRFLDNGIREIIHKTDGLTIDHGYGNVEYNAEGWTLSLAFGDRFEGGWKHFPTASEAIHWADNMSLEDSCHYQYWEEQVRNVSRMPPRGP